jgi:hypothetical protein
MKHMLSVLRQCIKEIQVNLDYAEQVEVSLVLSVDMVAMKKVGS